MSAPDRAAACRRLTGQLSISISVFLSYFVWSVVIDRATFAEQVLESVPSGVIGLDQDGRIVAANETACRLLDLPRPSELLGRPCRDALATCPDVARLLMETFQTRTPANRAELELRHHHRTDRTIGYTLSLVRSGDGAVSGAVMIFKDLTRIERLEEQVRLKDRLAVLGEMAAGLAHELRNPLAAIEIHAGLLRRAVEPSLTAHVESLDHILREVRRLNEAVIACLEYVRPVEVVERRVPVEALLETVSAESAPGATRILRDYAPGGTAALGDPLQLRQVFSNLVRNAREAAGAEGQVRLKTWITVRDRAARPDGEEPRPSAIGNGLDSGEAGEEPQVVVEVDDNGPGIPPEYQSRIFHPFFTTKPKGSGLGLAMVQKIVQSHRGRIDFTTAPGKGTTFRVVLRAAPEEPA